MLKRLTIVLIISTLGVCAVANAADYVLTGMVQDPDTKQISVLGAVEADTFDGCNFNMSVMLMGFWNRHQVVEVIVPFTSAGTDSIVMFTAKNDEKSGYTISLTCEATTDGV